MSFYKMHKDSIHPSSERDDLSENPLGEYKLGSLEIVVKSTKMIINR